LAKQALQALEVLSPGLVIHCEGPFQGQDYRVSNAALAAGAHYLDLADGRQFIAEIAASVNALDTAFGGS
jgi:saccharopine dehydrogenase-like NADP-dependent oxidoreductase